MPSTDPHQLPAATASMCPILTQYTASSSRNAQLSQLDLVLAIVPFFADKVGVCHLRLNI